MKRSGLLRAAAIVLFGALALVAGLLAGRGNSAPVNTAALKTLLETPFPLPGGPVLRLQDWQGDVLVLNFWATWCPPCRAEMPDFAAVSRKFAGKGVHFVGLSVDEPDKVRTYADELDIPYPLPIAGYASLALTAELGNPSRALPFTLVIDRGGKLVLAHTGRLSANELEGTIAPLLTQAARR